LVESRIQLLIGLALVCLPVSAQERHRLADLFAPPHFVEGATWVTTRRLTREIETNLFPEGMEDEGETRTENTTVHHHYSQKVTSVDDRGQITGALRFYREATVDAGEPSATPFSDRYAVYSRDDEGTWRVRLFALEDGVRRPVMPDTETLTTLLAQAPSGNRDWHLISDLLGDEELAAGETRELAPEVMLTVMDWVDLVDDGTLIPNQTRLRMVLTSVTETEVTLGFTGSLGVRGRDPETGGDVVMFVELEEMTLGYRRRPFQLVANETRVRIGLYGNLDREGRPFEIQGKGQFTLSETVAPPETAAAPD